MAQYSEMPDIEAVVSRAIRAEGQRSYSSIPNSPTYPLCTVKRLGGTPSVKQRLDSARIQIDAWAESKSSARDLAELARRIIHALEGEASPEDDAFVTGVDDETGLTYLPDATAKKERYVFGLIVHARSTK